MPLKPCPEAASAAEHTQPDQNPAANAHAPASQALNRSLPPQSSRVAFVLVAPSHPGNIGAAARAIKTMGFEDLRVVAPQEADYRTHAEAVAFSTNSVDVLEASTSYGSLAEALADVTLAFAMTGYSREFGPVLETVHESADRAAVWLTQTQAQTEGTDAARQSPPGKVAFVFGCERSGLTNEDVGMCRFATAIPANPESQSLNLAQSVQIAAYEMHLALLHTNHAASMYVWQERFAADPLAPVAAVEGFFTHWEKAMVACGALDPNEPKNMMHMMRRILGRTGLTQSEVDMLRGVCAAIILPRDQRKGTKTLRRKGPAGSTGF